MGKKKAARGGDPGVNVGYYQAAWCHLQPWAAASAWMPQKPMLCLAKFILAGSKITSNPKSPTWITYTV